MNGIARTAAWLVCGAWLLLLGSCMRRDTYTDPDGPNSGAFCDGTPCDWTVESGSVRPVPTWHAKAAGILMEEEGTVLTRDDIYLIGNCWEVMLVTDVEKGGSLIAEFDYDGDGDVEERIAVQAGTYEPRVFGGPPRQEFFYPRMTLRKVGPGKVVIGHLKNYRSDGCTAAPPAGFPE